MLESFNTDNFSYQKLSLEEQQSRGILGRLKGVIADTVNPTRNGRKYSAKLWEKVFDDPIMKEKIENRCVFGELGHPADREETDMEKIALCLAEQPKKGKDGKLYGVFDILNTPNGRILKTLCDYGCNIGISSRGSGDLITDMNGDEAVDEDTYDCQGFDAVLVPAVKEARLAYVTEALSKVKYNKSLKTRLQESLDRASADDKKVMKEALDTLGVNLDDTENRYKTNHELYKDDTDEFMNEGKLNEDDLHPKFRKDAKDQYKAFSNKKAVYDSKADKLKKDLKDLGETDPDKIDYYKDIVLGDEPVFKYKKGNHSLERQNYPFYVTVYEGTSYFHPEEGGYYQAGLEPAYSEGFQSFEEAQKSLEDYLAENSSTTVSFNPSNVAVNDDNYSYSESEEEYRPIYDDKDRLIGAIANGKYIGEEEQVWIEPNKQYLSRQVGYQMYESLNESKDSNELANIIYDTLMNNKQFSQFDVDSVDDQEIENDSITFTYNGKPYKINVLAIDESLNEDYLKDIEKKVQDITNNYTLKIGKVIPDRFDTRYINDLIDEFKSHGYSISSTVKDHSKKDDLSNMEYEFEAQNTAVDNNEAMVEELHKSMSKVKELQDKLVNLQEKLSVSYAKESKLNEEIDKQKFAIANLRKSATQATALTKKVAVLDDKNKLLESKLNDSVSTINRLKEAIQKDKDTHKELRESISNRETSNQKLNEKIVKLSSDNEHLTEALEDLKKDSEIKKSEYSRKLDESNKLVEKYKRIAAKSVDKYIDLQALKIGVDSNEIKNKLPESYTFNDIDKACESVKQYKVNISRLPFNTMLKEDIQIKATPSKNEKLANIPGFDDEVDDQLLSWANLD